MKKFTPYSIGRSFGRLIAVAFIACFLAIVGGAYVTGEKADNLTAKIEAVSISVPADQAQVAVLTELRNSLEQTSGYLSFVALAIVMIPAIHSMRLTANLGFQRPRVFVPELGLWLTHAGKALFDFVTQGGSNKQTLQDFADGLLKIESFADSIKCIITSGTGNIEIFSPSASTYRQGRIPEVFNNAALPLGTNIAVSHIGIAYATDATATVPEGDVDYTRVPTSWPAALANAEMLFKQNGAYKQRFATKFAGSQANGVNAAVESDGLEFETPFILEEQKATIIELRYANGQAVSGTNNHFLDICMLGAILRRKN